MGLYIESSDRPNKSGIVAETVPVGTLVHRDANQKLVLADANDHDDFEGVAAAPRRADYIATQERRDSSNFEYRLAADKDDFEINSDVDDRAPFGGDADRDIINVYAQPDESATAPDISDGDVVAFVDTTATDAPDAAGYVVEDGYTNSGFTADVSTADAVQVGVCYREGTDEHGGLVKVEVNRGN